MHNFQGKRNADQWIKPFRKTKKPYFEGFFGFFPKIRFFLKIQAVSFWPLKPCNFMQISETPHELILTYWHTDWGSFIWPFPPKGRVLPYKHENDLYWCYSQLLKPIINLRLLLSIFNKFLSTRLANRCYIIFHKKSF